MSAFQFSSVSVDSDMDDLRLALPANSASLTLSGGGTVLLLLASASFFEIYHGLTDVYAVSQLLAECTGWICSAFAGFEFCPWCHK